MAAKEAGRETWHNLGENEADPHARRVQVDSRDRTRDLHDHTAVLRTAVDVLGVASIGITQTGVCAMRNGRMGSANEDHLRIAMDRIGKRGGGLNLGSRFQGSHIMTRSSWRVT